MARTRTERLKQAEQQRRGNTITVEFTPDDQRKLRSIQSRAQHNRDADDTFALIRTDVDQEIRDNTHLEGGTSVTVTGDGTENDPYVISISGAIAEFMWTDDIPDFTAREQSQVTYDFGADFTLGQSTLTGFTIEFFQDRDGNVPLPASMMTTIAMIVTIDMTNTTLILNFSSYDVANDTTFYARINANIT